MEGRGSRRIKVGHKRARYRGRHIQTSCGTNVSQRIRLYVIVSSLNGIIFKQPRDICIRWGYSRDRSWHLLSERYFAWLSRFMKATLSRKSRFFAHFLRTLSLKRRLSMHSKKTEFVHAICCAFFESTVCVKNMAPVHAVLSQYFCESTPTNVDKIYDVAWNNYRLMKFVISNSEWYFAHARMLTNTLISWLVRNYSKRTLVDFNSFRTLNNPSWITYYLFS